MSSRATRMLEAAKQVTAARAAAPGAACMQLEQRSVEWVQLVPPVAGVMQLRSWEALVREQTGDVDESVLLAAGTGDAFALEDRNLTSLPWRRIYAVRAAEFFHIYDEHGKSINEPSDGVLQGRQLAEELASEFLMYYRAGQLSASLSIHGDQRRSIPEKDGESTSLENARLPEVEEAQHQQTSILDEAGKLALTLEGTPVDASTQPVVDEEAQEGPSDSWVDMDAADALETSDEPQGEQPPKVLNTSVPCHNHLGIPTAPSLDDVPVNAERDITGDPERETVCGEGDIERQGAKQTDDTSGCTHQTQDSLATNAEAAVVNTTIREEPTKDSSTFTIGNRVVVREASGANRCNGMVAHVGVVNLLVASDLGTWITVNFSELESRVRPELEGPPCGMDPVIGFTYDHANKAVVGMLLGSDSEFGLGGKIPLYKAHVSRPQERDHRLRAKDEDRNSSDFAIGDVVRQLGEEGGRDGFGSPCAVVVRVAYCRRKGSQQARKLLILLELSTSSTDVQPPATLPEASTQTYFPGSWNNWSQLAVNYSEDSATRLSKANIRLLDKNYKNVKVGRRVAMSAPNTAIKFATANKTPSQASQGPEEKSQGKTPQRGSKSKSRVGGGIMVASVVPTSMVASSTSSKIPCTRTSTTIELDDASNLDADDFVSLLNDNDMDDRLSLVSTSASKKLKASASCVPPNQAKVQETMQHGQGQSYLPKMQQSLLLDSPLQTPQSKQMTKRPEEQPPPVSISQPHGTTPQFSPVDTCAKHAGRAPECGDEMHNSNRLPSYSSPPRQYPYRPTLHHPPSMHPSMSQMPPPPPHMLGESHHSHFSPSYPYEPRAYQPPWHPPHGGAYGPSPAYGHPHYSPYASTYMPPMHGPPVSYAPPYANHAPQPPPWQPQASYQPQPYQQQSTPPRVRLGARLARMQAELAEMKGRMAEEEYKFNHL